MAIDIVLEWMINLDDEDVSFIEISLGFRFIKGANQYEVTYPLRLRLDKLIQKIQIVKIQQTDYISLIKRLAVNDKVDFETAKLLISEYKKMKGAE